VSLLPQQRALPSPIFQFVGRKGYIFQYTSVKIPIHGKTLAADRLTWVIFLVFQSIAILRIISELPWLEFTLRSHLYLCTWVLWCLVLQICSNLLKIESRLTSGLTASTQVSASRIIDTYLRIESTCCVRGA
jgi:hypothetical protein